MLRSLFGRFGGVWISKAFDLNALSGSRSIYEASQCCKGCLKHFKVF